MFLLRFTLISKDNMQQWCKNSIYCNLDIYSYTFWFWQFD